MNWTKATRRHDLSQAVLLLLMIAALLSLNPLGALGGTFSLELNTNGMMYGNPPVDQSNVPAANGPGGANSCAPTATANSLAYLTNAFPGTYGTKLLQDKSSVSGAANPQPNTTAGWTTIATQIASANYMNTDENNGTSVANWIAGTMSYINNNAPGTTMFESASDPSANFLFNEITNREDLEIAIFPTANGIGHVLTVSSVAGTTNAQGAITSMSIDGIDPGDPTHPFNIMLSNVGGTGDLTLTYGGNPYTIGEAIGQSPVPEPTTLVLLGLGACGVYLAARGRRVA